MKIKSILILLLIIIPVYSFGQTLTGKKLLPPASGIYAGVFPDMGSTEDSVTNDRISDYINLTGNNPVWVCFSNSWFWGIKFPLENIKVVAQFNAIPYIRIMPRHDWTSGRKDPVYGLDKIVDGVFDDDIRQWAKDARKYGKPILAEFAPEMNGSWFPWSGMFNGKKEGAELYIEAHRHVVDLMREEEADNITWMFHVNAISEPNKSWNKMKSYYPGDDYIDWIGMSIYGSQKPGWEWKSFISVFQSAYWQMEKISSKKPLAIAEFGVVEDPISGNKAEWIKEAFETILSGMYPRIKAISYWHSSFDDHKGVISNMRLDSSPEVLKVYKDYISMEKFKAKAEFKNY